MTTPRLTAEVEHAPARRQHPALRTMRRLVSSPLGALGLAIVVIIVLVAVSAPLIAPFDPNTQFPGAELEPPGAPYLLGTDEFGRDIFSRLVFGSRISLLVSLIAVGIGGIVGVITGLIAGYFGGWIDTIIMRLWDVIMSYPAIIVGIAIILVMGQGTYNVAYALGIVNIPVFSRLMRSRVLSERSSDYVLNAQSIGASDARIIFRHILPNTFSPILVQISLAMGFAVLLEAALSFLGLGAQPPTPSWGAMLNGGRGYLRQAWWYSFFPGAAIAFFVFGLNSITDALQNAMDPQQAD